MPQLGAPIEPSRTGTSGEGERAQAAHDSASAQQVIPGEVRITSYRLSGRDELDDSV
jgi:hypothetical protein